jgi:hypothetical protein
MEKGASASDLCSSSDCSSIERPVFLDRVDEIVGDAFGGDGLRGPTQTVIEKAELAGVVDKGTHLGR